ncbi:hypothetical protein RF11_08432 [Thelohanellus kitauei]|uniref:Uncharacterized protein n=1 Tax=Thelohanellus kitauei TaxID=669202 RepID=A0A0C2MKM8_THEKT|nr:hypothetical protein RF11_08432 [Thelohanellus kitauei]
MEWNLAQTESEIKYEMLMIGDGGTNPPIIIEDIIVLLGHPRMNTKCKVEDIRTSKTSLQSLKQHIKTYHNISHQPQHIQLVFSRCNDYNPLDIKELKRYLKSCTESNL